MCTALVVLPIYRLTSWSFDKFLELVIGCLNFVFEQHNYALLVFGGDFNVHFTSDTIQSQLLSVLFRGFGLNWTGFLRTRGENCIDHVATNFNIWDYNTRVVNFF